MFVRPIGSVVNPSQRPSGHPLLRGILARGAYVWDAAQHPAATAPQPPEAPAAPPGANPPPQSGQAPSPPAAPSARREPVAARTAPPPGPPGPASPGADLTDRLTQLAALAREGLLTPEEFSAAKARLLAG
ncbi:SHOCT domain-containing protein [Streptomyces sp. NPDC058289]|uniref:SHOCT domain-containing protein n=1 Tax=Streptomyces sp. NPDC058289 TaxID=3346425 RepID=UPI0036EFFD09